MSEQQPIESTDHYENIRRTIGVYEAALAGKVAVHYWSSKASELETTRYSLPNEEVPGLPDAMTPEFVESAGVYYAGTMSPEMLQRRIDELSKGNNLGRNRAASSIEPAAGQDLTLYQARGFVDQAWQYGFDANVQT